MSGHSSILVLLPGYRQYADQDDKRIKMLYRVGLCVPAPFAKPDDDWLCFDIEATGTCEARNEVELLRWLLKDGFWTLNFGGRNSKESKPLMGAVPTVPWIQEAINRGLTELESIEATELE